MEQYFFFLRQYNPFLLKFLKNMHYQLCYVGN